MIRALIVDDEPAARRGIRHLLAADDEISVVGECRNGSEAVQAIGELRPEILFLDIQMPEMDGFGVLRAIGDRPPPAIVFVTAHDEYALRAFDVHALDYLLKPFTDERFYEAVRLAKHQARTGRLEQMRAHIVALLESLDRGAGETAGERAAADAEAPRGRYLERLAVKAEGRVVFVPVRDVDWIGAERDYVAVHAGRAEYVMRGTLKGLERQLDPSRFVRIHRSTIVNLDRIRSLEPYFRGDYVLTLHDDRKLRLSRRYRTRLERALGHDL